MPNASRTFEMGVSWRKERNEGASVMRPCAFSVRGASDGLVKSSGGRNLWSRMKRRSVCGGAKGGGLGRDVPQTATRLLQLACLVEEGGEFFANDSTSFLCLEGVQEALR